MGFNSAFKVLIIIQLKFRLQRAKIHFYIAFSSQLEAFKFSDCTFVSCAILISCATAMFASHLSLAEAYQRHSLSVYHFLQPTAASFNLELNHSLSEIFLNLTEIFSYTD